MFSGIVECQSKITKAVAGSAVTRIYIEKPTDFDDISIGDSVAVDGICLTIEKFTQDHIMFSLAEESLKVTGWNIQSLLGRQVNLERSLRWGDRIHGHMVSGHVDGVGKAVFRPNDRGELQIVIPQSLGIFVWKKGSLTVNGVSLTVNEWQANVVTICLIPETLGRTNLQWLKADDQVNIEVDSWARAIYHINKSHLADFSKKPVETNKIEKISHLASEESH